MLLEGSVLNGTIVLDTPANLPDGTRVRIEPVVAPAKTPGPTLAERLKDIIGAVDNLPEDAAANVDHYLYGHPKK
jgi:hypothetical protein